MPKWGQVCAHRSRACNGRKSIATQQRCVVHVFRTRHDVRERTANARRNEAHFDGWWRVACFPPRHDGMDVVGNRASILERAASGCKRLCKRVAWGGEVHGGKQALRQLLGEAMERRRLQGLGAIVAFHEAVVLRR